MKGWRRARSCAAAVRPTGPPPTMATGNWAVREDVGRRHIRISEYMNAVIYLSRRIYGSCCESKPAPKVRDLDALTKVYAALADPTRLRILALLRDGEVCVCHLHASLDVPQPTASRHLAYLRKAGLVDARRAGIWMHYRLTPQRQPRRRRRGVGLAARAVAHRRERERRAAIAGRPQGVVITVLFACVHNAGRSQIAAALFNAHADPQKATRHFGGHQPGRARPSRGGRGDARLVASTCPARSRKS